MNINGSARFINKPILTNVGKVQVEVTVVKLATTLTEKDKTNGSPDLCKRCIVDAVNHGQEPRKENE